MGARLKRLVRWLVVAAMALVIGGAGVKLTGCAERLFYFPLRGDFSTPTGAEDVSFENSDGLTLHGWFLPAVDEDGEVIDFGEGGGPTVVHCHGNAKNIGRHYRFVEFLPRAGVNVFIFDYRSYGRSERGPLRRDGLLDDALSAIGYVRTRDDVDAERVGVYGLSLGGTIGLAAAAADKDVVAVCSVATFAEWKAVASVYAGSIGGWLIRDGLNAVDSAAALGDRPLLIVHGTDDEIVPYRFSGEIEVAASDAGVDVELMSVDGARHVDWIDTHPEMATAIARFFVRELGVAGDDAGQ